MEISYAIDVSEDDHYLSGSLRERDGPGGIFYLRASQLRNRVLGSDPN